MRNIVVKSLLGLAVASGFVSTAAQATLSQYLPFSSSSSCLNQFYRQQPPFLLRESLNKNSQALCFDGFNVMYSGQSKTPLWVSEHLTVERLSQKIKREDNFHEEERVSRSDRATLSDYRGSGYDRGHMAPNADMPTKSAQYDSFSLANMVPQSPKNNQKVWRELEEAVRAVVIKQKQELYVVTGPVFSGKKLKTVGNGVIVPSATYKAVYIPKKDIIGVYYAPNDNSLKVSVISVCQLEELTGINIFPQLSAEQKRNTYQLPLTAGKVKANQSIEYSHWDAESQCADDVSEDQLAALKKQFQAPKKLTTDSNEMAQSNTTQTTQTQTVNQAETQSSNQDEVESIQSNIIKQLFTALLHFLLNFLSK